MMYKECIGRQTDRQTERVLTNSNKKDRQVSRQTYREVRRQVQRQTNNKTDYSLQLRFLYSTNGSRTLSLAVVPFTDIHCMAVLMLKIKDIKTDEWTDVKAALMSEIVNSRNMAGSRHILKLLKLYIYSV